MAATEGNGGATATAPPKKKSIIANFEAAERERQQLAASLDSSSCAVDEWLAELQGTPDDLAAITKDWPAERIKAMLRAFYVSTAAANCSCEPAKNRVCQRLANGTRTARTTLIKLLARRLLLPVGGPIWFTHGEGAAWFRGTIQEVTDAHITVEATLPTADLNLRIVSDCNLRIVCDWNKNERRDPYDYDDIPCKPEVLDNLGILDVALPTGGSGAAKTYDNVSIIRRLYRACINADFLYARFFATYFEPGDYVPVVDYYYATPRRRFNVRIVSCDECRVLGVDEEKHGKDGANAQYFPDIESTIGSWLDLRSEFLAGVAASESLPVADVAEMVADYIIS